MTKFIGTIECNHGEGYTRPPTNVEIFNPDGLPLSQVEPGMIVNCPKCNEPHRVVSVLEVSGYVGEDKVERA